MLKWLLASLAWVALSYPVYQFLPRWCVVVYGVFTIGLLLFVASKLSKPKPPIYTTEAAAAEGLHVNLYAGKWKVAQQRVSESTGLTGGGDYWTAVRQYYLELGGE